MNDMKPIIAIIGDRHCFSHDHKAQLAAELGTALIDNGYRVMTGGVGSKDNNPDGVMDFVMKGARDSAHYSSGDIIAIVPGFDPAEASKYADIILPTGLDIYRNVITANADAVIAIGGGAGTLCEMANAWSLRRLIIAYSNVDGWSSKLAGTAIDNRKRYPNLEDMVWPTESASQTIRILQEKLSLYTKRHKSI